MQRSSILKKNPTPRFPEESPAAAAATYVSSSSSIPMSNEVYSATSTYQHLSAPSNVNFTNTMYNSTVPGFMNLLQNTQMQERSQPQSHSSQNSFNRNLLAQALEAKSRLGLMEDPVGVQQSRALEALRDYGYDTTEDPRHRQFKGNKAAAHYAAADMSHHAPQVQTSSAVPPQYNAAYQNTPQYSAAYQNTSQLNNAYQDPSQYNPAYQDMYQYTAGYQDVSQYSTAHQDAACPDIEVVFEKETGNVSMNEDSVSSSTANPSNMPTFESVDDEDEFLYGETTVDSSSSAKENANKTSTQPATTAKNLYFRPSFEFLSGISGKITIQPAERADSPQQTAKTDEGNKPEANQPVQSSPTVAAAAVIPPPAAATPPMVKKSMKCDELDDIYGSQDMNRKSQPSPSSKKLPVDIFGMSPPTIRNSSSSAARRKNLENVLVKNQDQPSTVSADKQPQTTADGGKDSQSASESALGLVPHPLVKTISAKKNVSKPSISDLHVSASLHKSKWKSRGVDSVPDREEISPSRRRSSRDILHREESKAKRKSDFDDDYDTEWKRSPRRSPAKSSSPSMNRESLSSRSNIKPKDSKFKRSSVDDDDDELCDTSSKRYKHRYSPDYHHSSSRKEHSDLYRRSRDYDSSSKRPLKRESSPSYKKHYDDVSPTHASWYHDDRHRKKYTSRYSRDYDSPRDHDRYSRDYDSPRDHDRYSREYDSSHDHDRHSKWHSYGSRRSRDRSSSRSSRESLPHTVRSRDRSSDKSRHGRDSPRRRSRREDFEMHRSKSNKTSGKPYEKPLQDLSDISDTTEKEHNKLDSLSPVSDSSEKTPCIDEHDSTPEIQEVLPKILSRDRKPQSQESAEISKKKQTAASFSTANQDNVMQQTEKLASVFQHATATAESSDSFPQKKPQNKSLARNPAKTEEGDQISEFFKRLEENRQKEIKQLKEIDVQKNVVPKDAVFNPGVPLPQSSAQMNMSESASSIAEMMSGSNFPQSSESPMQHPSCNTTGAYHPNPPYNQPPQDFSVAGVNSNPTYMPYAQYGQNPHGYGPYHQQYQYQQQYYNMQATSPSSQYYTSPIMSIPESPQMNFAAGVPPAFQDNTSRQKGLKKESRQSCLRPVPQVESHKIQSSNSTVQNQKPILLAVKENNQSPSPKKNKVEAPPVSPGKKTSSLSIKKVEATTKNEESIRKQVAAATTAVKKVEAPTKSTESIRKQVTAIAAKKEVEKVVFKFKNEAIGNKDKKIKAPQEVFSVKPTSSKTTANIVESKPPVDKSPGKSKVKKEAATTATPDSPASKVAKKKLSLAFKNRNYRCKKLLVPENTTSSLDLPKLKEFIKSQEKLFVEVLTENKKSLARHNYALSSSKTRGKERYIRKTCVRDLEDNDRRIKSIRDLTLNILRTVKGYSSSAEANSPEPKADAQYFFIDDGVHFCKDCEKVFVDAKQKLKHLLTPEHKEIVAASEKPWSPPPSQSVPKTSNDDSQDTDVKAKLTSIKGTDFMVSANAIYCTLCKICFPDEQHAEHHLHSSGHYEKYKEYIEDNPSYEKTHLALLKRVINCIEEKKKDDSKTNTGTLENKTVDVKKEVDATTGEKNSIFIDEENDTKSTEKLSKIRKATVMGSVSMRLSKKRKIALPVSKIASKPVFIGKSPTYLAKLHAKSKKDKSENDCSQQEGVTDSSSKISLESGELNVAQSKSQTVDKTSKSTYAYVPTYEESLKISGPCSENSLDENGVATCSDSPSKMKSNASEPCKEDKDSNGKVNEEKGALPAVQMIEDMDISDSEDQPPLEISLPAVEDSNNKNTIPNKSDLPSPPGTAGVSAEEIYVPITDKNNPESLSNYKNESAGPVAQKVEQEKIDIQSLHCSSAPSTPPRDQSVGNVLAVSSITHLSPRFSSTAGLLISPQRSTIPSLLPGACNMMPPPPGTTNSPGFHNSNYQQYNSMSIPPFPPPLLVPPPLRVPPPVLPRASTVSVGAPLLGPPPDSLQTHMNNMAVSLCRPHDSQSIGTFNIPPFRPPGPQGSPRMNAPLFKAAKSSLPAVNVQKKFNKPPPEKRNSTKFVPVCRTPEKISKQIGVKSSSSPHGTSSSSVDISDKITSNISDVTNAIVCRDAAGSDKSRQIPCEKENVALSSDDVSQSEDLIQICREVVSSILNSCMCKIDAPTKIGSFTSGEECVQKNLKESFTSSLKEPVSVTDIHSEKNLNGDQVVPVTESTVLVGAEFGINSSSPEAAIVVEIPRHDQSSTDQSIMLPCPTKTDSTVSPEKMDEDQTCPKIGVALVGNVSLEPAADGEDSSLNDVKVNLEKISTSCTLEETESVVVVSTDSKTINTVISSPELQDKNNILYGILTNDKNLVAAQVSTCNESVVNMSVADEEKNRSEETGALSEEPRIHENIPMEIEETKLADSATSLPSIIANENLSLQRSTTDESYGNSQTMISTATDVVHHDDDLTVSVEMGGKSDKVAIIQSRDTFSSSVKTQNIEMPITTEQHNLEEVAIPVDSLTGSNEIEGSSSHLDDNGQVFEMEATNVPCNEANPEGQDISDIRVFSSCEASLPKDIVTVGSKKNDDSEENVIPQSQLIETVPKLETSAAKNQEDASDAVNARTEIFEKSEESEGKVSVLETPVPLQSTEIIANENALSIRGDDGIQEEPKLDITAVKNQDSPDTVNERSCSEISEKFKESEERTQDTLGVLETPVPLQPTEIIANENALSIRGDGSIQEENRGSHSVDAEHDSLKKDCNVTNTPMCLATSESISSASSVVLEKDGSQLVASYPESCNAITSINKSISVAQSFTALCSEIDKLSQNISGGGACLDGNDDSVDIQDDQRIISNLSVASGLQNESVTSSDSLMCDNVAGDGDGTADISVESSKLSQPGSVCESGMIPVGSQSGTKLSETSVAAADCDPSSLNMSVGSQEEQMQDSSDETGEENVCKAAENPEDIIDQDVLCEDELSVTEEEEEDDDDDNFDVATDIEDFPNMDPISSLPVESVEDSQQSMPMPELTAETETDTVTADVVSKSKPRVKPRGRKRSRRKLLLPRKRRSTPKS